MRGRKWIAAVLTAMVMAVVLTACGGAKVDLKQYVSATFDGANERAAIQVDVDYGGMADEINKHNKGNGSLADSLSASVLSNAISYSCDKGEGIANGDTVTVTAVYDDCLTETYGCIPESDTKTYTVEGLDAYMTSFDGLPDGALDELFSDARDRVESLIANKRDICNAFINWGGYDTYDVDTQNLKLYTSYLLVSKGADFGAKYSNRYIAVYHTTGTIEWGRKYSGDMYIAVGYKDLKFDESGNLIVNLADADYTYFKTEDAAYNEWMTSNKDRYKVYEQKASAPAAAAPAADAAADTAAAADTTAETSVS